MQKLEYYSLFILNVFIKTIVFSRLVIFIRKNNVDETQNLSGHCPV